jgi:hypothetical protein
VKVGSIESLPAGYLEVLLICILVLQAHVFGILEPLVSWYTSMNPFNLPGEREGLPNFHLFLSILCGAPYGVMEDMGRPNIGWNNRERWIKKYSVNVIYGICFFLFLPVIFAGLVLFKSLVFIWGWIFVFCGLQDAVLLVLA